MRKHSKFNKKSSTIDHSDISEIYNNIATVYQALGDYSSALSYYNKALEILLKSTSPAHELLIKMYENIGSLHIIDERLYQCHLLL